MTTEEQGQDKGEIQSPEGLDKLIIVTPSKTWIWLWTAVAVIFTVFLWLIFGSIPIKVVGKGLVINREGLFNVLAQSDGTVKRIFVKPEQRVKKGDLIAELYDPELDYQIAASTIKKNNIGEEFDRLKRQIAIEGTFQKQALESDKAAKEFTIKTLETRIKTLQEDLSRKQRLHSQGLIALNQVHQIEQQLYETEVNLETTKANLATVLSSLEKTYRFEELKAKEEQFLKAEHDLGLLLLSKKYEKTYSPYDGDVLGLLVNQGDVVKKGTALVWLEHSPEFQNKEISHLIYGFVPIEEGKRIQLGTMVNIEPSNVNTQEYGAMLGRVTEISPFAVSPEMVTKTIHNSGLANYLTGGENATVMVIIEPKLNPKNYSGYSWTSGEGPPIKITTGTVCTIKAIVERIRPLYYVLPLSWLKNLTKQRNAKIPLEQEHATIQ